jgi:hypothetical protein
MQVSKQTKTVYNFRNTCQKCFNYIEFPLLGDFSYGEIIVQTKDGQDFFVSELINNETFNFIVEHLEVNKEFRQKKIDPQKVLTLVADRPIGKELSIDYPICPICNNRQNHYNDNIRSSSRELHLLTWNDFEGLSESDKAVQIRRVVKSLT